MEGLGRDKSQLEQWEMEARTPKDIPSLSLLLLPGTPSVSLPSPSVSEIHDIFCDAVF